MTINWIPKKYCDPVLSLRLYVGIVTVSCRLLQRMKIWTSAMPAKITQNMIMAWAPW